MYSSDPPEPLGVLFLSIVPSPYQRDLFAALHATPGVRLRVCYAEAGSPDSPWPREALRAFESVAPSRYLSWGGKRFILNWRLPDLCGVDLVVLNGYITIPAQWVLRHRRRHPPAVFWAEKMEPLRPGLKGAVRRFLVKPLGRSTAIVAIGKAAARDYRSRYPGIPVHELPYTCRLDLFQKDVPSRPRTPVTLLFCGQMIARKGVDLLLDAFAALVGEGLDLRLLLVGREADLLRMLETVPDEVRARVEYAGFQAPEDLPRFFARADVFVLPSRYDGWGVVVNQALGAGLPVVCSDAVGSAEDLVEHGRNGYVFSNGNAAELAGHLRDLVRTPGRIEAFAAHSLERSRNITPEQAARDWARIIRETIERHHARPAR